MAKKLFLPLIFSLLLAACVSAPSPTGHPAEELDQPQLMYDGRVYYYWATGFEEALPSTFEYVGSMDSICNTQAPSVNFSGCQLEKGQQVYADPHGTSAVYVQYSTGFARFSLSNNP